MLKSLQCAFVLFIFNLQKSWLCPSQLIKGVVTIKRFGYQEGGGARFKVERVKRRMHEFSIVLDLLHIFYLASLP